MTKNSFKEIEHKSFLILFTFTAFLGASLIFLVQPLVSKLLLPAYGGSASVWTLASFFFQVVLLAGYILVHKMTAIGPSKHPKWHGALMLLALTALPLGLPANAAPEGHSPSFWLIRTLVFMIFIPFLLLSTTGPLLQKWYSWTNGPRAEDPYFLYAASNVGSFFGLLVYPFALEPAFSLETQRNIWSGAYFLFMLMISLCGLIVWKTHKNIVLEKTIEKISVPLREKLLWIFLAFVPSSLMLGTTTYITTDIASIPLLWIIPLALYLATMIFAFGRKSRKIPKKLIYLSFLGMGLALTQYAKIITFQKNLLLITTVITFSSFAIIALTSHIILAAKRPQVENLTGYFVLVSLGGALGGLFNSLLAPFIFKTPIEYVLILALTPLFLLALSKNKKFIFSTTIIIMVASIFNTYNDPFAAERTRTFYGSYTVYKDNAAVSFAHGTTLHGLQLYSTPTSPTTYYSDKGPLGDVFSLKTYHDVTAVGLGAGTVSTYGTVGMNLDFIEIDPEVERIATKYFTYMKDSKARVQVSIGDGRIVLGKKENASQDLIILDAFSSDSVPIHLLTEEAFEEYNEKLTSDGIIAVHISNRFFDLVPVIVNNAKHLGVTPLYKFYSPGVDDPAASSTIWMTLSKNDEYVDELEEKRWIDLSEVPPVAWTDNYSSILNVLLGSKPK